MYYFSELKPCLYSQKSYYNNAKIEHVGDVLNLYSYDTEMMSILGNEIIYINENVENYTQTTLKHVKDFLYQTLGLQGLTKKDIIKIIDDLK